MEIRTYPNGPLQANLYVIVSGMDAIIIDPCVPYASLALDGFKVRAIICTHAHFDHIIEAENTRTLTGSDIFIYEDERAALMDAKKNGSAAFFAAVSIAPPVMGLHDGDILTANDFGIHSKDDFTLTVIHTPGHTMGSMCLLLTEKTSAGAKQSLFSGDTIFAGAIGRTDFGGSMQAMRLSIRKLSELPEDVIVLPGHGPATTIGNEKRSSPYFTASTCDDII